METMERIIEIATELFEEGYSYSEAYPIMRWKKRGFPEDPDLFPVIDSYINFLKKVGIYHGH